jgi:hypothetical protein
MRFGFFGDVSREYIITEPDTPLSWINNPGVEESISHQEAYLIFVGEYPVNLESARKTTSQLT